MIILLIFCLIIGISAEILILKKRKNIRDKLSEIKTINIKIDIIKELSYLLISSKNKTLNEVLEKFSLSFSKQSVFLNFSIIIKEGSFFKVYRYQNDNAFHSEDNKITSLENTLILKAEEELKSANTFGKGIIINSILIYPILLQGANIGYTIFYGQENITINEDDSNFLYSCANIINLFFKRFEFDKLINKEEQLKAVNVEW